MEKHAFGRYVLRHPINAIWIVAVCTLIPMMGWLASIVLGFVTLKQSWRQSLLLLAVLVAVSAAHGYWIYSQGDIILAMLSFSGSAFWGGLFLWLAALLRKRQCGWHIILTLAVIFGAAALIITYACMSELGVLVTAWLEQALVRALTMTDGLMSLTGQVSLTKQGVAFYQQFFVPTLANYFVGAMIVTFVYIAGVGQLMIANWWERRVFGSTNEFWHSLLMIRMPKSLSLVFIAAIILLITTRMPILFGLLPILLVAWLIAGLSITHALCYKRKLGWLILLLFYIALVALNKYFLPIVLLAACLDSFIDFRRRCCTSLN